jgi:hypothetical protein
MTEIKNHHAHARAALKRTLSGVLESFRRLCQLRILVGVNEPIVAHLQNIFQKGLDAAAQSILKSA